VKKSPIHLLAINPNRWSAFTSQGAKEINQDKVKSVPNMYAQLCDIQANILSLTDCSNTALVSGLSLDMTYENHSTLSCTMLEVAWLISSLGRPPFWARFWESE